MTNELIDWWQSPVLTGTIVRLEPIELAHAEGLRLAAGTAEQAAETFHWMGVPPPTTRESARAYVCGELLQRGERITWTIIDLAEQCPVGTAALYEVDPDSGSLAIGFFWVGHRWRRQGHSTEARVLLFEHVFHTLQAEVLRWYIDPSNTVSLSTIRSPADRRSAHAHRRDASGALLDSEVFELPAARAEAVLQDYRDRLTRLSERS